MGQSSTDIAGCVSDYLREGYATLPWTLPLDQVNAISTEIVRLTTEKREDIVHEADGHTVRAIHGCHEYSPLCEALSRLTNLIDFAKTVVSDDVYVYQSKVNIKAAHRGDAWPWHQDFAFWNREDGMPAPKAVNLAILIDRVSQDNGPLSVIPTSQAGGLLGQLDESRVVSEDWTGNVSARLSYTVRDETVGELLRQHGSVDLVGPAGTVVAFHPNVVHRSTENRSSKRRTILFITYNAISNEPIRYSRPEFLVSRNTNAIVASSSAFTELAAQYVR